MATKRPDVTPKRWRVVRVLAAEIGGATPYLEENLNRLDAEGYEPMAVFSADTQAHNIVVVAKRKGE